MMGGGTKPSFWVGAEQPNSDTILFGIGLATSQMAGHSGNGSERNLHVIFAGLMSLAGHGHTRQVSRESLRLFTHRLLVLGRFRARFCNTDQHLGKKTYLSSGLTA